MTTRERSDDKTRGATLPHIRRALEALRGLTENPRACWRCAAPADRITVRGGRPLACCACCSRSGAMLSPALARRRAQLQKAVTR